MSADRELRLVADVGGTNLRMGLVEIAGGKVQLQHVEVMATPAGRELTEVLASYWCRRGAPTLGSVAVCVAGPVDGSGLQASARLTNTDLAVSAQGLAHVLGVPRVLLVNDFAAIAAAAPRLVGFDLALHGPQPPAPDAVTVVLGPGTGLGVAAWLPGGIVVAGEGGHARLAPPDQAAVPIWNLLAEQFGFVAAEHVLCGRGLVTLYRAITELRGATTAAAEMSDAAAVWDACCAGHPLAREAVWYFTAALGAYAGDLALIFGAQGVLLAGGILPKWGAGFDTHLFRTAFEAKEPGYQARLAAIPSATVVHPQPALLGLGAMPLPG